MVLTLYTCYSGTIERSGEYNYAICIGYMYGCPRTTIENMREEGELVAGMGAVVVFFAKLIHPVLHTSGQTLLKCITKQI